MFLSGIWFYVEHDYGKDMSIAKKTGKTRWADIFLLILSATISSIFAEAALRIVFDPVDYLVPNIMDDDILGIRITPSSAGHDSWGYRNQSVPTTADIVAIGDSQTYGVSATSQNSWPALLQTMTQKTVYNLSVPGYNPVDYYHLLTHEAFKLNPSVVIVGFYLGNDLGEAYRAVYARNYWKDFRKTGFVPEKGVASNTVQSVIAGDPQFMRPLRGWLARHSVLYRTVAFHLSDHLRFLSGKQRQGDPNVMLFEDIGHDIRTVFTPVMRLGVVNLTDPRVQEGLRISFDVLKKMNEQSLKRGITLIVAVIPTKESVFAQYIENDKTLRPTHPIRELLVSERQVRGRVHAHFRENRIAYIDLLPSLMGAVEKKQIYPHADSHPNKEGYQIIAETIYHYLVNTRMISPKNIQD